jgi:hypothetical protein
MTLRQADSCRGKQKFAKAKLLKLGDLRGGDAAPARRSGDLCYSDMEPI